MPSVAHWCWSVTWLQTLSATPSTIWCKTAIHLVSMFCMWRCTWLRLQWVAVCSGQYNLFAYCKIWVHDVLLTTSGYKSKQAAFAVKMKFQALHRIIRCENSLLKCSAWPSIASQSCTRSYLRSGRHWYNICPQCHVLAAFGECTL